MLKKTSGIILNHVRYGDNGAVVYVFTESFGRQTYLIQGLRKKTGPSSLSLLQPLSIHELEVYHKSGRELQRIKEHRLGVIYHSIPYDIVKNTVAIFLAEILYRVLREEEPNPLLFKFITHSLQFFDSSEEHTGNFHIWFLIQLTRYLGFYPDNNFSDENSRFDMNKGRFVKLQENSFHVLLPDDSRLISSFLSSGISESATLQLRGSRRTTILGYIIDYYRIHLEGMGSIKSLDVLKEVFE